MSAGKDKGATTAQLRHAITSGRTGDKIDNIDPAAAPLGTDEEAAGTPPSPKAVNQAVESEVRTQNARSLRLEPAAIAAFVFVVAVLLLSIGGVVVYRSG